jgi:TP901 family phage tail tape measure protein
VATSRTVSVDLKLKVSEYISGLRTASTATRDFKDELLKSKKASTELADNMLVTGGALAGGFLLAAKAAADFDKQMSHVNAVTNASAQELEGLRAAAIAAGKDTKFSATEAAKAEEELAKAGITTADIIGGGLRGALSLAAAGSLDLAEAADIAAKAMNTFGLRGKDVPHIADVLAAAANKSATDVHELGYALKMGGLAAKNSGLTLEETTGILAAFADNALVGSDAGTSLKTMLQFLANPTEKASNLMARLGIDVYDAQGNFIGITKVAGVLAQKLGTLTQEERNAAFATIFGSDATRAATVLYKLGATGVQGYIDKVDDSGAAAEMAAKKTDNLAGDLERLKGSLETVAIQAGSGTNSGLRTLAQTAQSLVDAFGSLPNGVQSTLTVLAGVSGVGLLAAGGLLKVKTTVVDTLTAMRDMGPAGTKAADGISKIGRVAGGVTLAAGGVFLAYEGIKLFVRFLNSDVEPARRDVDEMTRSLKEFAQTGKVTGELQRAFGESLRDLPAQAQKYADALKQIDGGLDNTKNGLADLGKGIVANQKEMSGLNDEARKNVNQFKENIGSVDKALAGLVNQGGVTQAKLAFDELRETWIASGRDIRELEALLPEYAKAAAGAAAANSQLGQGFGNAQQNARTLNQSLQDLIASGQSVIDVFNQLNGAALDVSDAEIAAENAARSLTVALKESGGSLDITTEKGAAARAALNDMARKAAEAGQAVYNQTGSAQAAAAEIEKYKQKLINAAVAAGMARAEAEKLANELIQMPSGKDININVRVREVVTRTGALPGRGNSRLAPAADGAVMEFYNSGGMREQHVAQIQPAGAWRVWAEPETGGEAYIPLADAKRARSLAILADVNRRFGSPLGNAQPQVVEMRPEFAVELHATDPAGQALIGLIDVRITRRDTATARAVANGVRT